MGAVQEERGASPDSRHTGFEPDLLAFCCEH
jgi:hypothetical protein